MAPARGELGELGWMEAVWAGEHGPTNVKLSSQIESFVSPHLTLSKYIPRCVTANSEVTLNMH